MEESKIMRVEIEMEFRKDIQKLRFLHINCFDKNEKNLGDYYDQLPTVQGDQEFENDKDAINYLWKNLKQSARNLRKKNITVS